MAGSTEGELTFLKAWREMMADPDKVVLNAEHAFETADGHPISTTDVYSTVTVPDRGCFIGNYMVLQRQGVPGATLNDAEQAYEDVSNLAARTMRSGTMTEALAKGKAVAVLDEVIEAVEQQLVAA